MLFYFCFAHIDISDPGFLPPTSGTAIINNYDIRTNIDDVRMNLGLCPQHNILFDTLTVNEHLQFFARVRLFSLLLLSHESDFCQNLFVG